MNIAIILKIYYSLKGLIQSLYIKRANCQAMGHKGHMPALNMSLIF